MLLLAERRVTPHALHRVSASRTIRLDRSSYLQVTVVAGVRVPCWETS